MLTEFDRADHHLLLLSVWSYSITPFQMSKFQNLDMFFQERPFVIAVLYAILNIIWKYVDRYVSHFLDARFFGSVVLAVNMFWFIFGGKIMIIGCILNASIQFARGFVPNALWRNSILS